jgi:predicted nucleic acid-binding protein
MSKILLDTNFIISLLLENNNNHKRTIELKNEGIFENECYVTNLVIQELFTVLGMLTKDSDYVMQVYHMIKDNFIIIDEYNIDKFNDKVATIYQEYKTKLSFVDSSLIKVLEEYHLDSIVSFDKDLKNKSNVDVIS